MGILFYIFICFAALNLLGALLLTLWLARPAKVTFASAMARGWPTDPQQLGWHYEERTLSLSDGSTTPAWIIQGEQPDAPAILWSHGWGDSRFTSLASRASLLREQASQLVLYDLRGHGDCTDPWSWGGAKEVADLFNVVEQCLEPGQSVVLAGHSMGAGISLEAGSRWRDSAPAKRNIQLQGIIVEGIYQHWLTPLRRILWRLRWPPEPMGLLVWLISAATNPRILRMDRAHDAAQLNVPLLVIHGRDDWMCPWDQAQTIANSAEQDKLVILEEGGHHQLPEQSTEGYREALKTIAEWSAN